MTKRRRRILEAVVDAQGGLLDEYLRHRANRLMDHVLVVLERTLCSPNSPWQARAWAVEMVLRINLRYPDVVIEILTDRRFGTPGRMVVALRRVPRETRRLIRRALIEPRPLGPPPA